MEPDKKHLDQLIRKLMSYDIPEAAPTGFTDSVMAELQSAKVSAVTKHKPLIPGIAWAAIAALFLVLVSWVIFNDASNSGGWLQQRLIGTEFFFEQWRLNYSKTTMYAILCLVAMVYVQIFILKDYFKKRLAT